MPNQPNHMIFRTILIVLAAAVLLALVHYYNTKQNAVKAEQFYNAQLPSANLGPVTDEYSPAAYQMENFADAQPTQQAVAQTNEVQPADTASDETYKAVDFSSQKLPGDCFPKDRLTTEDLLPKDAANLKWSVVNPAGQGDVSNVNFVQAGSMVGINSTLGSRRNANLQLRSDPVIPNSSANWPIMMSTIPRNSAMQRRPLEIAGDCGEY